MTPEAQQKIRGMVELALGYVVEPKPLEVPTASGTIEELVEKMTKGLAIADSKDQAQMSTDEEAWDGESFGVRLGKLLAAMAPWTEHYSRYRPSDRRNAPSEGSCGYSQQR